MIDSSIIFPLKTAAIWVEQCPESNPIPVKNPAPNSESTAYKLIFYQKLDIRKKGMGYSMIQKAFQLV